MAENVHSPREELRGLIARRLLDAAGDRDTFNADELATAVMGLFGSVVDDWRSHDVSSLGELPGSAVLWSRALVAWVHGCPTDVTRGPA